jgi:hypothetical protein
MDLKKGKKLYGDYCLLTSDCDASGNYICDFNKCTCSSTTWYSNGVCGWSLKQKYFLICLIIERLRSYYFWPNVPKRSKPLLSVLNGLRRFKTVRGALSRFLLCVLKRPLNSNV